MRNGRPLSDKERLPWLISLRKLLLSWHQQGKSGILACSALKQKYRHLLNSNLVYTLENQENRPNDDNLSDPVNLNILFILLNCDKSLIEERLYNRKNHDIIKDSKLVQSQFDALELPSINECLWTGSTNGKQKQSYLSIEKSFLNNTFYYIFVIKCFKEASACDIVENILDFLPKFDHFKII